ncbi:MAG: signal peptidase II [Alphaproteobacteria bacterium]|nr:signal peptidase II [Alphaproteobacteria bacterium]
MTPRDRGLLAAAAALVLDQGSKLCLLHLFGFAQMRPGESVVIAPFFDLVMVWNPGISYGLFPADGMAGALVRGLFSLVAIVGLGWWGLGLVIGGAVGNLIDRLVYGAVADFFHFYAFGYDWYVFNVADVAITFGVIAILYDALLGQEPHAEEPLSRSRE